MAASTSSGKAPRLARCFDGAGRAVMLAADQRGSLRRAMDPVDPSRVEDSRLVAFKVGLARALAPEATALLLDPEYGAAQVLEAGALPDRTGMIVAMEATGYSGEDDDRRSSLLPGFSAARAVEIGASAAKLLVHYHPDAPGAPAQERLVAATAEACAAAGLPLIVEPLSFPIDGRPLDGPERRRVVIATARRISSIEGVDVVKAEFPAHAVAERTWADACEELTSAAGVPWVLLSAGVDFESFARRAEAACAGGASGVLVGRAVWGDAVTMSPEDRDRFYATVGLERMRRLAAIVAELARPAIAGGPAPDAGAGSGSTA